VQQSTGLVVRRPGLRHDLALDALGPTNPGLSAETIFLGRRVLLPGTEELRKSLRRRACRWTGVSLADSTELFRTAGFLSVMPYDETASAGARTAIAEAPERSPSPSHGPCPSRQHDIGPDGSARACSPTIATAPDQIRASRRRRAQVVDEVLPRVVDDMVGANRLTMSRFAVLKNPGLSSLRTTFAICHAKVPTPPSPVDQHSLSRIHPFLDRERSKRRNAESPTDTDAPK